MKPFTEYLNDSLVQASQSVLSGHGAIFEQNEPKPIKQSEVQAGDTVEWYNGAITFREKVFEKDGKLYVAGTPGRAPILVSSIRLPLHLAQKSNENAKAVRAAKRETQLLKTREKSLADKRKRAGLTEEKTVKIVATADHGAIRKGDTFTATAKTNSMGQTRIVINDTDMPRATIRPTLFLGNDGKPDGSGQWNRFAIVEASSDQLEALTKVMQSMGASYGDINNVRDELESKDPSASARFLVLLANAIGNDTTAFNAFVKASK
jgi:hypothetical protein